MSFAVNVIFFSYVHRTMTPLFERGCLRKLERFANCSSTRMAYRDLVIKLRFIVFRANGRVSPDMNTAYFDLPIRSSASGNAKPPCSCQDVQNEIDRNDRFVLSSFSPNILQRSSFKLIFSFHQTIS